MPISEIKQSTDAKMQKALDACKSSLSKIRTGRAHVGLLDHIHVDYYGTSTPLNQVANVTLLDARTLGVTVWEKNMATVVDKAIRDSDLGLNPQSQGTVIRVPMPPLSPCAVTRNCRSRYSRYSNPAPWCASSAAMTKGRWCTSEADRRRSKPSGGKNAHQ